MTVGRLGGALVVVGWVLLIIYLVAGTNGVTVGVGVDGVGALLGTLTVGTMAAGAAGISLGGPRPLDSRGVRVGQGILALGLLSTLTSMVWAGVYPSDPLESWPIVILFLVGVIAVAVGVLTTTIALVLARGWTRRVGWALTAGLGLGVGAIVAGTLAIRAGSGEGETLWLATLARSMGVVGSLAIVGASMAIGVVAIRGEDRPAAIA